MSVRGLFFVLMALLLTAAAGLTFWRCEGEMPTLEAPEALVLGREPASVTVVASDERSGLRRVRAVLRHAGGEAELARQLYAGELLAGAVRRPSRETLTLEIDPQKLGLAEGEATLEIEAVDWSWRGLLSGNVARLAIPVTVDLSPPRAYAESGLTYVRQGGSAAVVYGLDEAVTRDGVLVGDSFFPGYPFPSASLGADAPRAAAGRRFALFAVPRNAPSGASAHVLAEDAAGNRTRADWPVRVQERHFEDVRINLSDDFLSRKVPSLANELGIDAPDPLAAFQRINSEVRAANEAKVQQVVAGSGPVRHWRGAFVQFRNSAVTSRFAEHRAYFVSGKQVSEAIHYGYDLASTAHAPVGAANAGRVLLAERLGIYGNCVILDHGQGLTSLYAHLSRIDVREGDPVEKGQTLGLSGSTGLAGGDHLHFAMLVGGSYVDPKEWWDPRWVRDHVEVRLAAPAP